MTVRYCMTSCLLDNTGENCVWQGQLCSERQLQCKGSNVCQCASELLQLHGQRGRPKVTSRTLQGHWIEKCLFWQAQVSKFRVLSISVKVMLVQCFVALVHCSNEAAAWLCCLYSTDTTKLALSCSFLGILARNPVLASLQLTRSCLFHRGNSGTSTDLYLLHLGLPCSILATVKAHKGGKSQCYKRLFLQVENKDTL